MNSEHLGQDGCHLMLLLSGHRSHIVSIDIKTVKLFLFENYCAAGNERKKYEMATANKGSHREGKVQFF